MSAVLPYPRDNGELGDKENAVENDRKNVAAIFRRVCDEGLGDKTSAIVDQRIDAMKARHSLDNGSSDHRAVSDVARHGGDFLLAVHAQCYW